MNAVTTDPFATTPPAADPLAAGAVTPPAAAPAPVAPPTADNPNVFRFEVVHTGREIEIDYSAIPANVKLDMLKKAIIAYINNPVSTAKTRADKANAAFDQYDAAQAANPMQTAVAKPDGERVVPDLIKSAAEARDRLYKGEVRKTGEGRKRETKDPLTITVTNAVVRELHEKNKATTPGYKYTDAVKEVGSDGIAYLKAKIAEKVAAGADAAALDKMLQDRYIKPAMVILGQGGTKAAEQSLL